MRWEMGKSDIWTRGTYRQRAKCLPGWMPWCNCYNSTHHCNLVRKMANWSWAHPDTISPNECEFQCRSSYHSRSSSEIWRWTDLYLREVFNVHVLPSCSPYTPQTPWHLELFCAKWARGVGCVKQNPRSAVEISFVICDATSLTIDK